MERKPNVTTTSQKKAYKAPHLAKYGQLKDLTTGGSTGKKEGGGQINKKA